jgi:hypothetical protein
VFQFNNATHLIHGRRTLHHFIFSAIVGAALQHIRNCRCVPSGTSWAHHAGSRGFIVAGTFELGSGIMLPIFAASPEHAAHGIPPWSPSGVLTVRDGAYLPNSRWVWGLVPMLWPHVTEACHRRLFVPQPCSLKGIRRSVTVRAIQAFRLETCSSDSFELH